MRVNIRHEFIRQTQSEDADTTTVHASVEGYGSTFTAVTSLEEFNEEECWCKENLNYFLMGSGISNDDTTVGMLDLINYVSEVTSSASSDVLRECALEVWLSLLHDDHQIEEAVPVQASLQSHNIRFRPASTLVVESLPREIYEKNTDVKCTICLEEFNKGTRVVTLPCEHYFHDECAVTWFETSHVCPLCRFELPMN